MLSQLFTLALAVTIVSADSGVPVFPRYFPLSNSTSAVSSVSSSSSSSSSSFFRSTTTIPAVTPHVVKPSTYTTLPYYANTTASVASSSAPVPVVSSKPVVAGHGSITTSTTTTTSTLTITHTGTITMTAPFGPTGTTTVSVFYAHPSGAAVSGGAPASGGAAAPTSPAESGIVAGNGGSSPAGTRTVTVNKTMTLPAQGTAVLAQGSVPAASGAAASGAPAVSSCPAPVTVYVTQPAEIKTVTVTEKHAYPSVGYHTKSAPYPTGSSSPSSGAAGSTGFLTSYKSTGTAPIPAYSSST